MLPGIQKYIDDKLIAVQSHPEFPELVIYNYTNVCQYAGAWDETTQKCRGLIFNTETGEQLSNPLPKFFNYAEHIAKRWEVPNEKPFIAPKYDGWCGILYWRPDGMPAIATRGSFDSTGARWATAWLHNNVAIESLDPDYTYVFEIIAPETKIVVNYDFEGLILLAKRHLKTGEEHHIWYPGMVPILKAEPEGYGGGRGDEMRYAGMREGTRAEIAALHESNLKNEEGFVIFFPKAGKRMKVKFEEYTRLHKIMTGLSAIGIWEALASGQELSIENVPDEFFEWFNKTKEDLIYAYQAIQDKCNEEFFEIKKDATDTTTRAQWADRIKQMTYPGIGFAMLDDKDYSSAIWKMVRPSGAKVYKKDDN